VDQEAQLPVVVEVSLAVGYHKIQSNLRKILQKAFLHFFTNLIG
jgi:hypothetical protein